MTGSENAKQRMGRGHLREEPDENQRQNPRDALRLAHFRMLCIEGVYPVLRQKTVYKALGHNGRLGILPLQPCGRRSTGRC